MDTTIPEPIVIAPCETDEQSPVVLSHDNKDAVLPFTVNEDETLHDVCQPEFDDVPEPVLHWSNTETDGTYVCMEVKEETEEEETRDEVTSSDIHEVEVKDETEELDHVEVKPLLLHDGDCAWDAEMVEEDNDDGYAIKEAEHKGKMILLTSYVSSYYRFVQL